MREQTPDLKTFGRIDGALLHGTALTSPVFKTVLGLWLQTKPSAQERTRCLACHVPAVTVFPQHTDHFITQVMTTGKLTRKKKREMVEGIGCSACHLINKIKENPENIPAFHVEPGKTLFGPYDKAEECFPQHTDHFITQVMTTGKLTRKKKREMVEGIGCSACHLINKIKENPENIPAFHVEPGKTLFGPYDKAEDNLVHPSAKADIYRGAQFCASCHFSKVKDDNSLRDD